jgi:hypothetical protein
MVIKWGEGDGNDICRKIGSDGDPVAEKNEKASGSLAKPRQVRHPRLSHISLQPIAEKEKL